jgi:hypothetical protein
MTRRKATRATEPSKLQPRPPVASAVSPPFIPSYPPGWFDRVTAAIERLPVPYWALYLAAFLVYAGLVAAAHWRDSRPMSPEAVYSNSLPFYGFWLIHYLNRSAAGSLRSFRPAFTGNDADLQDIHWRLTTLPAWPAAVISMAALLTAVSSSLNWSWTPLDLALGNLAYYATMVFAGLYAYHAVRQLRLVTSLYAKKANVDIHNVAPLYSFSTLAAQTAIGMLLVLSGAVLFTPAGLVGGFLVGAVVFAALAVMTFLLPLTGLHRRLAEAKEHELLENDRRWQASTTELYRRVDRRDWAGADRLNATLTALERGRTAIERVPTWPWRPETLRGLVAAVLLPAVIWLIQFGLQRVLG